MYKFLEMLLGFLPSFKRQRIDADEARRRDAATLRSIRDMRVVELGPALGNIRSFNIPQWVKVSSGEILQFKGYVGDDFLVESLPDGHVVIEPGLLYGSGDGERADPGA